MYDNNDGPRSDSEAETAIREAVDEAEADGRVSRRDLMKLGGFAGITALIGGGASAASGLARGATVSSGARMYSSTEQTLADRYTWYTIAFDSANYDKNGDLDLSNNAFVAPESGLYLAIAAAESTDLPQGEFLWTALSVNGTRQSIARVTSGSSGKQAVRSADVLNLAAGDSVTSQVRTSSAGNTLSDFDRYTYLAVVKLGGGSSETGSGIDVADDSNTIATNVSSIDAGANLSAVNNGNGDVTLNAASSAGAPNPRHVLTDQNTRFNLVSDRPLFSLEDKTYYVSANGDDDNGGESSSDPLASLAEVGRRLPYMLYHGLEVIVMTNTDGPATNEPDYFNWPPVQVNYAGDESEIYVHAEGTDPTNHRIDCMDWGMSFRGAEVTNIHFQGLQLDCRPQSYDGLQYWDQCLMNSSGDPNAVYSPAVGGYGGIVMFRQVEFGGNVETLVPDPRGMDVFATNCRGTVDGDLLQVTTIGAGTLRLNNNNLNFDGYISNQSNPSIIVEDGQLIHPNS